MDIICAPSGIVDIERPGQGLSDMAHAGFQNMLLDLAMLSPLAEPKGEAAGEQQGQKQQGREMRAGYGQCLLAEPLLQSCRQRYLNAPIAIAPFAKRDTKPHPDYRPTLEKLTLESIKTCANAGAGYLIVHPLPLEAPPGTAWEENRSFYLSLAHVARENGVTILLENSSRSLNGHFIRGACAEADQAASWVDSLNEAAGEERFGFCMNTGTYNLCGQSMREAALRLGDRVKAVILRDCDGQQESALLPFTSVYRGQPKTDWLSLIRGLREIGFDGHLILDFGDTASAFSPLIRPQLLALARSVGEYFRWQIGIENALKRYGSIVLFGAGNMCRNYMKCYGEKYPPLFTCDNNATLWGTSFCGLEVKNPESLASLPEDCAIFICNIYYREIEAQLKGMGIRNPIECFNDEYMPSFHYDRLPTSGIAISGKT